MGLLFGSGPGERNIQETILHLRIYITRLDILVSTGTLSA